jgi:outer membrane protein assembly factor BamB
MGGVPKALWSDYTGLWIACEEYGPEGGGEPGTHPGIISRIDPDNGNPLWTSPTGESMSFRSALRSFGRIMLLEKMPDGRFQVRAFKEETGELYRTVAYSGGEFLWALESSGRLIFLHQGSENQLTFDLYYASLNLIKSSEVEMARDDQPFSEPEVDNTLFLYAGTAFSLYDGNRVWQIREDHQKPLVGWTSDADRLYVWENSGSLLCLERITGLEVWRTPFNVLPPPDVLGPNHGGASMILDGARLLATTPGGELFRVDASGGEPNPGVIRVPTSLADSEVRRTVQPEQTSPPKKSPAVIWIVFAVVIVAVAAGLFAKMRPRTPKNEPGPDDWLKR